MSFDRLQPIDKHTFCIDSFIEIYVLLTCKGMSGRREIKEGGKEKFKQLRDSINRLAT